MLLQPLAAACGPMRAPAARQSLACAAQLVVPPQRRAAHARGSRAPARAARAAPPGSRAAPRSPQALLMGDNEKEASRKYRRTTFDHERWAGHRSTVRYWRHVASMLRSRIVKGLAAPLLYVGGLSTFVCIYEALLHDGQLPDWGFAWPAIAVQAGGVYSLSTFALSLLLVFRTNGSYQRWNEARKLWGLTVNRCRDLARQGTTWMDDPRDAALCAAVVRHISAFPIVLMDSLRNDHVLHDDLEAVLQPAEVQLLLAQAHPGTAVLQQLGALVAASHLSQVHKMRMDEQLTTLQDCMGGAERIFKTPLPLSYTRHTSRFLMCWLTCLPFCVADSMGVMTVPIACGLAFFLLGIEEIGVQIEEPHGILALELFCDTVVKNVRQAQDAAPAMRAAAELLVAPQPQLGLPLERAGSPSLAAGSLEPADLDWALLSAAQGPGGVGSNGGAISSTADVPLAFQARSVAGREVPAAERAHAVLPSDAETAAALAAAAASAAAGSSSSAEPAAKAAALQRAAAAAAAAQQGDLAAYWRSSVGSGAGAEDSGEYTF